MKNTSTPLLSSVLLVTSLTMSCTNLQADTLGLYLSASSWSPEISGTINNEGSTIDVRDQLGFDDDSSSIFSIALEHPIFMIPNIKIQLTGLNIDATSVLTADINFGGITFPSNSVINSKIDLSHTDTILYYEVLDNWISLDLGINIMNFDGDINLSSTGLTSQVDLDEYVPTLYVKAKFELPATGFYTSFEGSILSIDGNSISDYKFYLGWESDYLIGAEIGYQRFEAEWDGFDSSDGNLSFEGYFATITMHF